MPKKLPFSKDDFHKMLDQKLQPRQPSVIEKLKTAAKKKLGGTL